MKLEKHHIDGLIKKYVRETLDSDEEERLVLGPVPDEVQKDLMESFKYFEDHPRYFLRTNNLDEIEPIVDMRILEPNNLEADKDSYEYKKLCRETFKANIPIAHIQMKREQGDYSDDNVDYYPGQEGSPDVTGMDQQQESSGPSLKTLLDKWLQENTKANSWSPRTYQRYDGNFRIILQILGDDFPIDSVDHGTVRDLKDTLLKLPADMNKKTAFQDKTVPEIIELNQKEVHSETLSVSTINAYLTTLGAFFKWCVGNGYMSQNYADGFKIKTNRTRKRPDEIRQAFTPEHLNQIFNAPEYTEDKAKTSYQFWLPVLGLYTGARMNELCQLRLKDVQIVDGIPSLVIVIQDDPEDETVRVKNSASRRTIPLHPFVSHELNFMGHVQKLDYSGVDLEHLKESKWAG